MNRRTKRVASLIRGELARIFVEEISDPDLSGLAVTEVTLSDDLKHAKVFFEGSELKDLSRPFQRAMPYIKRRLGNELPLRYVPDLKFHSDSHSSGVHRVLELIEDVQERPSL